MKKLACLLLAILMTGTLLPAMAEQQTTELVVFAAASMTETLTRIKALYEAAHPGVSICLLYTSPSPRD